MGSLDCRICGNYDGNSIHTAHEMMYGTRDKFDYIECCQCGCLQIAEIPLDVSKYYPSNYYSYNYLLTYKTKFKIRLKTFILNSRLHRNNIFKSINSLLKNSPKGYDFLEYIFKKNYLNLDTRILDVGCGSGAILLQMHDMGFTSLRGLDPFLEKDLNYNNGVQIQKKYLDQVDETYDFIMLHHAFEHIVDPYSALNNMGRIISPNGYILIRIPVSSSFAWSYYATDWVQLDAPRHIYLHSCESMRLLAMKTGFEVVDIEFDSVGFQFWGSEQYRMGIPLMGEKSYVINRRSSIFSRKQIKEFSKRARDLNHQRIGDQACFILKKNS